MLYPRDPRVPRIRIPSTSWPIDFYNYPERYRHSLFVGKITQWKDILFADGYIVTLLGVTGDIITEMKAVTSEYNVDIMPYPESIKEDYRNMGMITDTEYNYRANFTNECVFTIDPASAEDVDDALSWKALPGGGYMVCEIFNFLTCFTCIITDF